MAHQQKGPLLVTILSIFLFMVAQHCPRQGEAMVTTSQDNWKQTQQLHTLKFGKPLFGERLNPKCLCFLLSNLSRRAHFMWRVSTVLFENSAWERVDEQRSRQFESIWTSLAEGTDIKCCEVFSRVCVPSGFKNSQSVWFTCDFLTFILNCSRSKATAGDPCCSWPSSTGLSQYVPTYRLTLWLKADFITILL